MQSLKSLAIAFLTFLFSRFQSKRPIGRISLSKAKDVIVGCEKVSPERVRVKKSMSVKLSLDFGVPRSTEVDFVESRIKEREVLQNEMARYVMLGTRVVMPVSAETSA